MHTSIIYHYLKKVTSNNIQGLFQFFSTYIINIEGKYRFFVHFFHQTFIALVLVISIFTLDMSIGFYGNVFAAYMV